MLNLTPRQLVSLWHELELCRQGKNGYGGDTAEVYAYRLRQDNPSLYLANKGGYLQANAERESGLEAMENLLGVLRLFEELAGCRCLVDGQDRYVAQVERTPLVHRCHVRVIPKE